MVVEVGGMRVHVQRSGAGPALLLVHGLVGSARNWRQNVECLSRSSTVYAVDLPNMGESERVAWLDAGLAATADGLASLLDALGLREAAVAGHSHGAAVAMMLAARHPHRVRELILFAPANPFCERGRRLIWFFQTRWGMRLARRIPTLPRWVKEVALGRMFGDRGRITPGTLEGYTDGLRVPGTIDHILSILRRWAEDMRTLRAALPLLEHKPMLLIWGDRDRAVGLASAYRLGEVLPASRLLVIPGAGHIPFAEAPEVGNRAMTEWLGTPDVIDLTEKKVILTLRSNKTKALGDSIPAS